MHRPDVFKWFLAISFFTDAIDGYLARRYKVVSFFGSRVDSIADDLTIATAVTAVIVLKPEFLWKGIFLLLFFFLAGPVNLLCYIAAIATMVGLLEEIILVLLLPGWQTDMKGLYWIIRKKKTRQS